MWHLLYVTGANAPITVLYLYTAVLVPNERYVDCSQIPIRAAPQHLPYPLASPIGRSMSDACTGITANSDVAGIGVRIRPHLTLVSFAKQRRLCSPGAHQLLCHYGTPRPCPRNTRDPRDLGGSILQCRPGWPWPPRDSCRPDRY
jgi:hypothetical protein